MGSSPPYRIALLGAGNVATHLSRYLQSAGNVISCVYSRTGTSAERLASSLGCAGISDPDRLPTDADFYIISVADRGVPELANRFSDRNGIWLHTSGALPIDLFRGRHQRYGVLYPLQTMSMERPVSLEDTPILVEGSDPRVTGRIRELALQVSGNVQVTDYHSRVAIHLAAVFANNFSNHMMTIAQSILEEKGIDPGILDPLIRETFSKLSDLSATGAQTGPALRGDVETMGKHLELLAEDPEWKKIYTFISADIRRRNGGDQF